MKKILASLSAIPVHRLGRHPDVLLAVCIAAVVAMLILPVPTFLLDGFLALDLALAALVLVVAILADKPLALSTFPSILLFATLFRLSLNVSTTRLILSKGNAGEVVRAFGEFVVGGDVVVGLVIFLVITLVQFLVISKGSERVAEVGARFTLDAMPGKQMSIDAAVRAGSLEEDEAQAARDELSRESQFHGAMDGAMKFVKGDAIAGIVITGLNLIAGFVIGVSRNGMSMADSANTYAILTVGDGLVSQIPALLISISAGVLTTRVASRVPKGNLAFNLSTELLSSPKALGIGAGFSLALGLVPGLPLLPFLFIGGALGIASFKGVKRDGRRSSSPQSFEASLDDKKKQVEAQRALVDELAPAVPPIGIDLDPRLSAVLGFVPGSTERDTELLGQLVPQLRDALYLDSGVRFPGIRVRSGNRNLPPGGFVVRLKDTPVVESVIPVGKVMASESPAGLRRFGIQAEPAEHPIGGFVVSMVDEVHAQALSDAGVTVHHPSGILLLHLAKVLRENARMFVGLQETSELMQRLEKVYPALVREVVPKMVSLAQLADVLRRLVDEGVSIRDMKSVLEALAEHGQFEQDGVSLTEIVRSALSRQIGYAYAGTANRLAVVVLDPIIEDTVRGAIQHTNGGSYLALDPELRRSVLMAIAKALTPVLQAGVRPVILTTADVRRYVRKLVEVDLPKVAVLSFQELPNDLTIQPMGRVTLGELAAAA